MRKIFMLSIVAMLLSIASFGQVGPIFGPDHICVGATATMSDSSTGGIWFSNPTTIATIGSSSGIVTGVSAGVALITYYRPGVGSATKPITINPLPSAIGGPGTVYTGGTITLTDATSGGVWSSSCPTTLTVNPTTGVVTGVGPGTCLVTYTLTTGCSTHRYVTDSTVTTVVDPISGPSTVCTGSTVALSDSTPGGTWSSSNTAIATVSSGGIVTGVSAGTVIITYTLSGTYVIHTMVVSPASSISGPSTLCVGSTITLTGTPSGGTWSSSNTSVATVTGGAVTGISAGTATIYYNAGGCYSYHVVTVTPGPSAIGGTTTVGVGGSTTLTDATTGGIWLSSNSSIALIGSLTGIVTGISTGTCTISYYVSGCIATVTFTVGGTSSVSPITGSSGTCVGSSTVLSDATPGGVWSSSNPAIASITSAGIVTGVSVGTCTITYTVGSSYVTTSFTVATSATITGVSTLCVGSSTTLTSTPTGGTWSSGTTTVATVTSGGVVSGVGAGIVNIYYTVSGCYAYKHMTVNALPATITGTATTTVGGTSALADATTGGTWSSSNTSIATVNATSGVVTGVSVGTCTITYSVGGCFRTITFAVTTPTISPISGPSTVCVGSTIALIDATSGGTWSSSNTAIATVSSSGVVTGVAAGTVTITYTVGSSYVTASVAVNPLPATITGPTTTTVGGSVTLSDATSGGIWSSTNTSIATVNATTGVVTGVSAGVCGIIYTVGGCTRYIYFTVTSGTTIPPITGPGNVCAGATITLADAASGGTWSSSNTAIATINATSGVLTGVSAGTVTITYTVGAGYVTTTVVVNPLPSAITGTTSTTVGGVVTLSDATTGGTWSSTNSGIASVNPTTGVVTGVSTGTCSIIYTTAAGCMTYVPFTVTSGTGISPITGPTTLCSGSTATMMDSTSGGTWSSSNTAIATINATTGVVTGVSAGTVTITYTVGTAFVTRTLVVTTGSSISGSSTLCVGSTITLTGTPSGGIWSSSGTSVATVGSTGVVTGVSAGTVNIYYLAGGCYSGKTVTVNAAAVISGGSTVCIGSTTSLTATPGGGVWSSGNTAIATVSTAGLVTGVASGVVNIYYTSGGCAAYKTMTVNTSATITGSSMLCVGTTATQTGSPSGGTWTSSNTSVATVSTSGIVTGVAGGTATIYYVSGGCAAYKVVTVNTSSSISGSSTICTGSSTTLTGTPGGGTWSSSNTAVATVSTAGVVTGVSAGTVNIYYNAGGCYSYKVMTVNATPTITGSSLLCVGTTAAQTGTPSGGTWTSSSTGVATVSTSGVVTGVSGGTATIYYNSGGCYAYKVVTVNTSASISGSSTVCAGSTTTLTGTPGGGTWLSSNTAVATVSTSGVVTGIATGTVNIYYNAGGCYAYKIMTVNPAPLISGSSSLCIGTTITLSATPSGGTWSSSSTGIASVSSAGVVTGVSAGTATIYYNSGGCYTYKIVTVNPAASITGPGTVCAGSSITLSASVGGGTWSSSSTATATVSTTGVVTGVTAGVVNIYYSSGGCASYKIVTVNAVPTISGGSSICYGFSTTLTGSPSGGTWLSSDSSVATVSSTGVVTGVAGGTVNIYYTVGGCSAYRVFTVNATAVVSGGSSLCVGTTLSLSATPTGGIWSSGSTGVATVSTAGVVTGVSAGTANIYYLSGGCYTYHTVTVSSSASISGASTVCTGASTTLTGSPTGGTWSSSSTGTATISTGGVVTGASAGVVVITYSSGGCTATHTMTVNATGTISGSSTVCTGSTVTLTGTPSGGTWASGYTAIATVGSSTGIVTGITPGTITVYYSLGGCYAYRSMTVNPTPTAISGPTAVCTAHTVTLSDATAGGTWTSGNTSIATVSSVGVVTGVAGGVVNIYYTIGSCGVYHTMTVNPAPGPITGSTVVSVGSTTTLSDGTPGGTWVSANPSIATVNPMTGVVTGVSTGTVVIYYSVGACGTYVLVNVTTGPGVSAPIRMGDDDATSFTIDAPELTGPAAKTTGAMGVAPDPTSEKAMSIFPNPTSGSLNIQWQNEQAGDVLVTVSDMTGRVVYSQVITIKDASGQTQIGLGSLKDGIYLISIKSDEIYYSNKLFIQH